MPGRACLLPMATEVPTLACMNRLLFGGNLQWRREAKLFPDASVDGTFKNVPKADSEQQLEL